MKGLKLGRLADHRRPHGCRRVRLLVLLADARVLEGLMASMTKLDKLPDLSTYQVGNIRRFTNPYTQAALDGALSEMGPDDPVVVAAHQIYHDDGTVVENVTKLSAVVRVKGGVSVMVGAFKDWTKPDKGIEAKVVWKPKF